MNDHDRVRLQHMLDASREAVSFLKGRTSRDLVTDRLFLLAMVKEIEIVGEAATQISSETRSEAAAIPWPKITAMRNRLVHAYFNWNADAIWVALTTSLPPLIVELEKILDAPAEPG